MLDVVDLKEQLCNEEDKIITVLEKLGCGKIKYYYNTNEIRASIDELPDSNPNSIRIKLDTLSTTSFSDRLNCKGDFLNLIQEFKKCNLPDAIKFVCEVLGIENEDTYSKKEELFGGYFKGLRSYKNHRVNLQTYPESILDDFYDYGNKSFKEDGIDYKTQTEFKVQYDVMTNRFTVPWRNLNGEIIGIIGRYNADEKYCKENEIAKWLPVITFPKSQAVFGLYENYNYIMKNQMMIIGESEKSVMQLRSMKKEVVDKETGEVTYQGINVGVAIGCHSVSPEQVRLIQSCYPKRIIVAFDEGIEEDYIIEECKKLQYSVSFFKTEICYIFDRENKYMPKGSKCSPMDKGVEVFQKLLAECLIFI